MAQTNKMITEALISEKELPYIPSQALLATHRFKEASSNKITGYRIFNPNNQEFTDIQSSELKSLMKAQAINLDNLRLTKDGRLITTKVIVDRDKANALKLQALVQTFTSEEMKQVTRNSQLAIFDILSSRKIETVNNKQQLISLIQSYR